MNVLKSDKFTKQEKMVVVKELVETLLLEDGMHLHNAIIFICDYYCVSKSQLLPYLENTIYDYKDNCIVAYIKEGNMKKSIKKTTFLYNFGTWVSKKCFEILENNPTLSLYEIVETFLMNIDQPSSDKNIEIVGRALSKYMKKVIYHKHLSYVVWKNLFKNVRPYIVFNLKNNNIELEPIMAESTVKFRKEVLGI